MATYDCARLNLLLWLSLAPLAGDLQTQQHSQSARITMRQLHLHVCSFVSSP